MDPISRLKMAVFEIDATFGEGHAAEHPQLVAAVVAAASSDFAATLIAHALGEIAAALAEPEQQPFVSSIPNLKPFR